MTAKTTASASHEFTWKRAFRALMSVLALFLVATLLASCAKRIALREYKKGIAAYEKKDYEAAVKHFSKAAKKGNSDAMLMKGWCLITGKGVKGNEKEGVVLIRKAADAGNPDAQGLYGFNQSHTTYFSREQKRQGAEYLKKAIDQGCVFAMNALGQYYGFNDDLENKAKYLKMAAEQPLSKGGGKTFWDYYNEAWDDDGEGTSGLSGTNYFIVLSQYELGILYEDKIKDLDEARKWYKMAADNGYADANDSLKRLDKKD